MHFSCFRVVALAGVITVSAGRPAAGNMHVGAPDWEGQTTAGSVVLPGSIIEGSWVASGRVKVRLSLDTDEMAGYGLGAMNVYANGDMALGDCKVRDHWPDGSGDIYSFDRLLVGSAVTFVMDPNIGVIFPIQGRLDVACWLDEGDRIYGAAYDYEAWDD